MIQALLTPGSGRVLLDGNNTVIKIKSTNGFDHYFRATIYINGIFFDEQGWSRIDAYTATRDIKNLLKAYFSPQFNQVFASGLTEQTQLIRRIKIEITEYNLVSGTVTGELTLPEFSVMYNIIPEEFSDGPGIKILGIDPEVMVVPPKGKISIPFYVNSTGLNVQSYVETEDGTGLNVWQSSTFSGPKIFLLNYDLTLTDIGPNVNFLRVIINAGDYQVIKIIRINHLPAYPIKELAFRNNFGFYLYAYPFGEMEKENALDVDTYLAGDGIMKASNVNQETTYSINSGALKLREKAIINQLATSIDPWINTAENYASVDGSGKWLPMVPKTKKLTLYKDKQNNYNDELQFTVQGAQDIPNTGFIAVLPSVPDIQITNHTIEGHKVTVHFVLNNGFNGNNLRIQFRTSNSSSWNTMPVIISSSPFVFSLSTNEYYLRLVDWTNVTNVSNQILVEIED